MVRAPCCLVDLATGSLSGHHTIAFRDPTDGVLYVHESTDKPPGLDPYYPPPYGVRRAPWDQWMADAVAAEVTLESDIPIAFLVTESDVPAEEDYFLPEADKVQRVRLVRGGMYDLCPHFSGSERV